MIVLCIVMVIALALASVGVYALIKRFIWREVNEYIPFIAGAVFVIICAVLMTTAVFSVRKEMYNSAYEDAYASAEAAAERKYTERLEEYTKSLLGEYDDIYSMAYGSAFEEFTSRAESLNAEENTQNNEDDTLKLITDEETEDENEGTVIEKSTQPQEEEKTASGTTVYYTKNGSVLHKDKNCRYLKNADEVLSCDINSAPSRRMCSSCG